jgi:hypothetical protein
MRNDPDKELLNDLVNEEIDISTNRKNKYYRQKLLETAQTYYNKLGTDCIKYYFKFNTSLSSFVLFRMDCNCSKTANSNGVENPSFLRSLS